MQMRISAVRGNPVPLFREKTETRGSGEIKYEFVRRRKRGGLRERRKY